MYVSRIKRTYKGKTYESVLVRESYRDASGRVHQRTLASLTKLPPKVIDAVEKALAGQKGGRAATEAGPWDIERSLPHGHVAAVLGTMQKLGLPELLARRRSRERQLATALVAGQLLWSDSKLGLWRRLRGESAASTLGEELGLDDLKVRELYEAMDWLLERQGRIQRSLAERHLNGGTLLLYDVTSAAYTGRVSELVQYGYSRAGRRRDPQIVYGLLCNAEGCPIAVQVFAGNTADPRTVQDQVQRIREEFGVERVVLVGDRGMLTSRRIEEDLRGVEGFAWITALRADTLKRLARTGQIQRSLFDERDLAEIQSPDFPGERLIVCRNPFLAEERARKREELLAATERQLQRLVDATQRERRPLRGSARIGQRLGRILAKSKVAKHFRWEITENGFRFWRDEESIAREAALDGIYVVRTSVPEKDLSAPQVVAAYKALSRVEWAFRAMKASHLELEPIRHYLCDRIRAHVFVCMLAYYVRWHMERALAPLLFVDDQREEAERNRASVVARAPRSASARGKEASKRTAEGFPVHSFETLLDDLATLSRHDVRIRGAGQVRLKVTTRPTPLHKRVFHLLGLSRNLGQK